MFMMDHNHEHLYSPRDQFVFVIYINSWKIQTFPGGTLFFVLLSYNMITTTKLAARVFCFWFSRFTQCSPDLHERVDAQGVGPPRSVSRLESARC